MGARVAVFGGTFDPIHLGHLIAASEVVHRLGLDRVLFVPSGRPWQKARADLTPAHVRLQMTLLGTGRDARFGVSRVDIDRPGPTYTADTLSDLHRAGPHDELFFIVGADALGSILTWREPQRVLAQAHLIGVTRPGHVADLGHLPPGAATIIPIPGLDISSSLCRERVRTGLPLDYLVPADVVSFIAESGLYRTAGEDAHALGG